MQKKQQKKKIKKKQNKYFCHRGEDCLDAFIEKMNKIFDNFGNYPRKRKQI